MALLFFSMFYVYSVGYLIFLAAMILQDWEHNWLRNRRGQRRVPVYSMTDYLTIPLAWPAMFYQSMLRRR